MNKKVMYIIGGIAVVGIAYYLYNKNKKKSTTTDLDGTPTEGGETKSATAPSDAPTSGDATTKAGQNIKELKGKEKRAYRKDVREVCHDKYGKGKDYRDCLDRVKSGGVAFDGSNIQDQFYSGMDSGFDVSFR